MFGIIPSIFSGTMFKFYDNSHVCIGLPLALDKKYVTTETTRIKLFNFTSVSQRLIYSVFTTTFEGYHVGQFFSSVVFLGVNCICYLVIVYCYVEIVRTTRQSSKRVNSTNGQKRQVKLTIKVTTIIATDFICWFPVIILGILIQTRLIMSPPSVYAWLVTFVLPINSAINPYMYTIAEIISNMKKKSNWNQNQIK